jgi:hypothetical protein
VGFVATPFYTTAAQLGFALHDSDVTALSDRHDQYDYWFDPVGHTGQDAIVVTDTRFGTKFATQFESITKLEELKVERYGTVIYRPAIYLAHNFKGAAPAPPVQGP